MIGQTIAHYKVTAKLGAGGMGEVYRATDSKLGRDVALKVLPEAFAQNTERMQRFQREAQVLASLNHPHIAAIHGLEHAGKVQALAMELVEGPTLAERIAQGAIPVEEALPIAKQIAEALEYAHEKGIVHRDLKPANVKLTAEGQVKILDFGLAKALQAEDSVSSISADFSPTLSLAATKAGIILGTAAYMAPEQARGKQVDRRADIWSFGVVLYEMLSGQRAFSGEDISVTLANVIKEDPDWEKLPARLSLQVQRLLRRCLTKDARNRLRDIGEARVAIEEAIANPQAATAASAASGAAETAPQPAWRRALPWAATAVLLVAVVLAMWRPWQTPAAKVPVRLSVELGADTSLFTAVGAGAVLSPDGMRLAFVAQAPNQPPLLYVRSLDQLKASPLSGTEGASSPFFSPDSQWIAFFAGSKLRKVAVQGGAVVALCDAGEGRGGWWGEDDQIVFAATTQQPLSRVPAGGGTPQALTELDEKAGENTHRWPQVLPGGKAVLFTAHTGGGAGDFDNATIVVQSLETKQRKTLYRGGSYARYLPSGHLMYMHEGTLFAAPMDLNRLELTGPPAPVVEGVVTASGNGGAQFSFSNAGTLVYSPGRGLGNGWSILWLDSQGKVTPLRNAPALYFNPQFSPDGTRLALEIRGSKPTDVHVYDWKRDTLTRLTFGAAFDGQPVWTPDGRWISFTHQEVSQWNLYWTRSDGTGQPQRLAESKNEQYPDSWHPGGRMLAFEERNPQTDWDVMILPLEGDEKSGWKPGQPTPFLNSPFEEWGAAFSPDGRWLAYTSNESGTDEVYVRPFPSGEGKWQISSGGGSHPTWSRNGRELFYRNNNKIMVTLYRVSGTSFQADKPRGWSDVEMERAGNRNYDLHPDGKRFAILRDSETQGTEKRDKVTLVLNFFDELRRVAPPGGKTSQ